MIDGRDTPLTLVVTPGRSDIGEVESECDELIREIRKLRKVIKRLVDVMEKNR